MSERWYEQAGRLLEQAAEWEGQQRHGRMRACLSTASSVLYGVVSPLRGLTWWALLDRYCVLRDRDERRRAGTLWDECLPAQ